MTINVQIDTPFGAPGIFAVNYFKNANVAVPRLQGANEYRVDNLIDPVNGGRVQIRLISTTNDLIPDGAGLSGGTIDRIEFFGGTVVNGLINTDPFAGAIVTGLSIDAAALYQAMLTDNLAALDQLLFQADVFIYTGNVGNDTFTGGTFGDIINGGGGKDTLNGREGADTISGGAANDTLDGGTGTDTVNYSYLTGGQNLTLTLGTYDAKTGNVAASSASGVAGDVDSVKNFENIFGGVGNDKLTGNATANTLEGGGGNDTLSGLGGGDLLDGGDGIDVISYATSSAGVVVNLNDQGTYFNDNPGDGRNLAGNFQQGGDAAGDLLWGIDSVVGSAKDDILTAKNADNSTQLIDAGAGNDFVYASKNGEVLLGGLGTDTLSFAQVTTGIAINLAGQGTANALRNAVTGGTNNIGEAAGGYSVAEFENIIGGSGADDIVGNAGANVIEGGAGTDELVGGLGVDTLSYASSSAAVTVLLYLQGNSNADGSKNGAALLPFTGGDAEGDEVWGFENIIGSAKGDLLEGDLKVNNIQGGDGDDVIAGYEGNDILDGGAGFDIADYGYLASGKNITVTLGAVDKFGNVAQTSTSGISGDADTLKNFEGVRGNTGDDKLTGNAGDNLLSGRSGADIIAGLGGADILDGDGGTDTVTYAASAQAVTVDFSLNDDFDAQFSGAQKGGDAEGDKLAQFEILIGSKKNDILVGRAGSDDIVIDGGDGDDVIGGQAALNYIIGGAGNDTIHYGDLLGNGNTAGINTGVTVDLQRQLTFNAAYQPVFAAGKTEVNYWQSSGNADGALLSGIENIVGSHGDDVLTGDKNVNILEGGKGADTLIGIGVGDKVSYAGSSKSVFVNLENAFQDGIQAQDLQYDFGSGLVDNGDAAGDILTNFTVFIGSKFGDVVQGNSAKADTIFGGDGNDDISGGGGKFADYLDGGEGDDNLYGGDGGDTLIGGNGNDWAAYSDGDGKYTVGIAITLGKNGTATGFSASGGEAAGDKLTGIENIAATAFADVLTGNELDNWLFGLGGDDKIAGMAGADFLDGNKGIDTVVYSASKEGVTVSLAQQGTYVGGNPDNGIDDTTGTAQTGGDALGDKLWGFENITGSKYNDKLTGDHNVNIIDGDLGDDTINGNDGGDILIGGTGNDTVSYATSGAVSISLLKQGTYTAATGKFTGQEQQGSDAQGDKLSGFENIIGSGGDDTLIGDNNANVIEGGAGADILVGLGGIDTVSYASSHSAVTVSLWGPYQGKTDAAGIPVLGFESQKQDGGHASDDQLYGFENIIGSAHNDVLTALNGGSSLWGGDGNDQLSGGDANKADKLYGGDGDDALSGLGGGDLLDGGKGMDTVHFAGFVFGSNAVTVTLGKNDTTAATVSGAASGHKIFAVEHLVGAGGNDKFTANNEDIDNIFIGFGGSDTLSGMLGDDTLDGGDGNDTLIGGEGADTLDGGNDFDTADYSSSKSAVTISMSQQGTYVGGDPYQGRDVAPVKQTGGTGDSVGDLFWSIERVVGSAFNDTLKGDTGDFILDGGKGDDLIIAGSGEEILVGGDNTAAGDTVSYLMSDTEVTVSLLLQGTYNAVTKAVTGTGSGKQSSTGFADGDLLSGFENVIGSIYADTITGDAKNNVIEGDDGGDTLFGGGGIDTVSYKGSVFEVTVDLSLQGTTKANGSVDKTATAQNGGGDHAAGDLLYGFENIIGSDSVSGDVLYGDNNANTIDGGAGNDEIAGYGGVDILRGGAGDDVFKAGGAAGAGADTYDGGADNDQVNYRAETLGVTVVLGVNGASATVSGGSNAAGDKLISIEQVLGGSGNDRLTGNNLAHTLDGGNGNDTLIGGTGDSLLEGGKGDDTIFASTGLNEFYSGGDDDEVAGDTLSFANFAANTVVNVNLDTGVHSVTGIGNLVVNGFENLIGGAGHDTLVGNATTTTKITGGAGNDTIRGGTAIDTLTGGTGNDTFVFVDSSQGKDVFTDFANGDKLQINKTAFAGGLELLANGALTDASYLVVGAGATANNATHGQFIYNITTDVLSWDADGTGVGAAVEIGQFGSSVVLKLADFTLV